MTLLQKKCFVAAAGLHGLLVLILVVGPGFRSQPKAEVFTPITMLSPNIIDGPSRGGSPDGGQALPLQETPPPKTAEPAPAVTEPPKPTPKPPEPVKPEQPERETPAPTPIPRPAPTKIKHLDRPKDPAPPRIKRPSDIIVPDLSEPDSREQKKAADAAAKAAAKAAARAEAKRLQQIHDVFSNASGGLTHAIGDKTAKTEPRLQLGPGGGGPVFAGYTDLILNMYKNAWDTDNLHLTDLHASTAVEVTVARNGSIISSKIIRRSGESALDRSVEKALRKITQLPSFPADSTDAQRTFTFTFDPEAKL